MIVNVIINMDVEAESVEEATNMVKERLVKTMFDIDAHNVILGAVEGLEDE